MPEHSTKMNDRQVLIKSQWQPKLTALAEKCSSPTATQKEADEYTHAVQKMQREVISQESSMNDYSQYENILGEFNSKIQELQDKQEESAEKEEEFKKIITEQRLQLEKVDASQKKTAEFEKKIQELTDQVSKLKK